MLAEIRQAIADAVTAAIPDLQVSPWMLSDPSPPAAHIFPTPVDYDKAFQGGLDIWTFTLEVFVAENSGDRGVQMLLDEYLEPRGPRSIKEAVEADETLGGLVFSCRITTCQGYRRFITQGRAYVLGTEFVIEVQADRGS